MINYILPVDVVLKFVLYVTTIPIELKRIELTDKTYTNMSTKY